MALNKTKYYNRKIKLQIKIKTASSMNTYWHYIHLKNLHRKRLSSHSTNMPSHCAHRICDANEDARWRKHLNILNKLDRKIENGCQLF